jgi:transcription-repair coupling factor (superfamily II helicase)
MKEGRGLKLFKRGRDRQTLGLADAIGQVAESDSLRQLVTGLRAERRASLEGIFLGALPPALAAWLDVDPRPMLIITPHIAEAEAVAAELSELLGLAAAEVQASSALQQNSPAAAKSAAATLPVGTSGSNLPPVEYFPTGSEETELESLAHQETAQRLHVLSRLYKFFHDVSSSAEPTGGSAAGLGMNEATRPPIVVTTLPALMQSVPSPESLEGDKRILRTGGHVDVDALRKWLIQAGYQATSSVQLAGEFAVRGGILDIFPPDEPLPVRIELFDDEIESVRTFDVVSQRSIERRAELQLLAVQGSVAQDGSLLDYLPAHTLVVVHEQPAVQASAETFLHRVPFPERFAAPESVWKRLLELPYLGTSQVAMDGHMGDMGRLPIGNVERIGGDLEKLAKDIDQHIGKRHVVVIALNEGERSRLQELLAEAVASREQRLSILVSQLQQGFEILPDGMFVLTAAQLLRRSHVRRAAKRANSKPIDSFLSLRAGDLVVHLSHGIGVYRGTELLEKQGQKFEHLVIEFDGGTRLFVPSSKIELIQRYVGGTKSRPKLAKIGGQSWTKQRKAAERAVKDMAVELLELQASRRSQPGVSFAEDSIWQNQFDASFSYVETPDQLTAIMAVKQDMVNSRPMDRLICGDVGFGKTEVAMRAAFKAVDSGYQVAVLVPTTVLAEQHFKTFRQRMAEFPFHIEKLSRFASTVQQRETVKGIGSGRVDIVIGTHRLASKDIKFYNLGLLIIDEEQRFGVEIKERLKQLKTNVDVITLSATPIPRTLHMSLVGVRDISNLETPPEDRLSVETRTIRFDEQLIRNAVLRELNRDGQVYFVHNRVHDIEELAARIKRIVPEASLVVGHGQMHEGELEQVMIDFIDHKYDILLATTIIESGLDIPNANTIFIDQADHYGLAELHQLRGRVGRYKHQAYCYLLIDKHKHLSPDASRRLHAIEEYSQIGAGFGIAMRDLEIRGAGNLLGTQQSGHIAAVGYELYCQMLGNAVRELTHQPPALTIDVEVDLPIEAFLPESYVPELRQRIDLYRRLSRVADVREIDELREELQDRFGKLPKPAVMLLQVAELKIDAALWLVRSLQVEDDYLVLTYSNRGRIEHLAKLHDGRLRIVDGQKAYWLTDNLFQHNKASSKAPAGAMKRTAPRGSNAIVGIHSASQHASGHPGRSNRKTNWIMEARHALRSTT